MPSKRTITGTVVSDKADQTIVVQTERRVLHPLYRKPYLVTKKFAAHDPKNEKKVGDVVTIEETRPLSARKRFILVGAKIEDKPERPAAKPATKKKPTAKPAPSKAEPKAKEETA